MGAGSESEHGKIEEVPVKLSAYVLCIRFMGIWRYAQGGIHRSVCALVSLSECMYIFRCVIHVMCL